MFNTITEYIDHYNLLPEGTTVVVGLSGGPDSVFLLHFLVHYARTQKTSIIAAHLDHEWRATSGDDVVWCKKVCEQLGVPFVSARMSDLTLTKKTSSSKEEIGRTARRQFLESVRQTHNADVIALAHHADDQQETFFIRLLRGTTLTGLVGMQPRHGVYIRPLLSVYKKDIVAYLDTHKITYLTDPTNVSPEFLRNRIRAKVIPALRECDARFDVNFANTHAQLQQAEEFLEQLTTECLHATSSDDGLMLESWCSMPEYLRNRVLVAWLYAQKIPFTVSQGVVDEIVRFIYNDKSKEHTMHEQWAVRKHKGYLQISHQ